MLGDVLVTRIDIHLSKSGEAATSVLVVYERTALVASANERVQKAALDAYAKRQ
jgi:hypothetical protein